jgi:DNA-binding CsgD family transcriptional regulator
MAGLVGRDTELDAIRTALDRGAGVVLVEGEPGIGKTAVWQAALELATDRGAHVLACAASQSETQLAFTVVRDLVGRAFDDVALDLPEPQRRALSVVLLREEPPTPLDPAAISVAFLGVLTRLADDGDVVVAVDDVQWVDPSSSVVLRYALRRLDGTRITAVVTRRAGLPEPGALPPEPVETVSLGGLSVGALGRLLHQELGRTFTRPVLVRLHELSGGNALHALEVARALPDAPRHPLPVPPGIRELVAGRLTAFSPETVSALGVVAAVGRASTSLVGAAMGSDPVPLLEPAVAAGVLAVDGDDVRFAHPIFAAVVYELAALRRRELHARLAELVDDPEQRARHLALATDTASEAVAALVERGAAAAHARGSPAAAAELAAEAARLTPDEEDEPLRRRTIAEADYRFAAGDTAGASALLERLLAEAVPGPLRSRLLARLGRLRHFERDIGASVGLLYAALEDADDDVRGEIEEGLAWGLLLSRRDLRAASDHARSAVTVATERDDTAALAEALAAQGLADFVLGRPWERTMERALALEGATLDLRVLRHPSFAHGYVLSCSDDLVAARAVFEGLRTCAEEAGDEGSLPSLLNHLTLIEVLAGRWELADAYATDCYDRAVESDQRPTQISILGKTALLASRRGDTAAARATALSALGEGFDPTRPSTVMEHGGETAAWALASLELELGRPAETHAILGPLVDALLAAGVAEPGEVRFLPDEIEALVQLGDLERAGALLRQLEDWASRDERPPVLAAARRCRGLLQAARGEIDAALTSLGDAAELAAQSPLLFERARTQLDLGTHERRARRRRSARDTLGTALALADDIGATLLAGRARDELSRIGGRTSAGDELTPSEQRIATLVAAGKTNKEVAAALVVTERTVESALTQVYRKLEVRSRTELARRLHPGP